MKLDELLNFYSEALEVNPETDISLDLENPEPGNILPRQHL